MKPIKQAVALFTVLFLATTALLAACATTGIQSDTTGIQRGEKTKVSMEQVESDINQTVAQIDATNASLDQVIKTKETPDVNRAFTNYSDNVAKMQKVGNALIKHTDEMTVLGNDYFMEWQKSGNAYTNPAIQKLSQEKRNELLKTFSQMSQASPGVKGQLNAYLSDIEQIRLYLSNDLTPKGIMAIDSVAQKAINDGNNVKTSVQPLLEATAHARAEMSTGGAAPAETQNPDTPQSNEPNPNMNQ